MAKISDKESTIAAVYAAAMLELAHQQNMADELLSELLELSKMVEGDADFASFLSSPTVETEAKGATIEKIFRGRSSDLLVDSLQILNRKGRLGLVCSVAERYRLAHADRAGQVDIEVTTAVALPEALRGSLEELLAKATGKSPRLVETVDSSLLGGLVVQLGDKKYDMSVSRRLKGLKDVMMQRASRELHGGHVWVETDGAGS